MGLPRMQAHGLILLNSPQEVADGEPGELSCCHRDALPPQIIQAALLFQALADAGCEVGGLRVPPNTHVEQRASTFALRKPGPCGARATPFGRSGPAPSTGELPLQR